MAKRDSVQKKIEKIRPPRVQLTYDVEIGDATEQKEIPFVVGVLGNFAGQNSPDQPPQKLKDRKFVNIDLDSFGEVMKGIAPKVSFRVSNKIGSDGGGFLVDLEFNSLEDFRPESIVQQVAPLRKLQDARARLNDLRNKLAGNDRLEDLLTEVLADTEQLKRLGAETDHIQEQ